jgi:hypothetical protein
MERYMYIMFRLLRHVSKSLNERYYKTRFSALFYDAPSITDHIPSNERTTDRIMVWEVLGKKRSWPKPCTSIIPPFAPRD